jgi:imidazolonepropionase-like amidohydrolase
MRKIGWWLALAALLPMGRAEGQDSVLAITGVTLIDGTGGPARATQTVLIRGGRIAAVGPAARLRAPAGARLIDGRGKTLIPGLWDMHTHVLAWGEKAFPLLLANGVTTVREAGSAPPEAVIALRERVAAGKVLGPRLLVAGPTLDAGFMRQGPWAAGRWAVGTAEEGRRAVDSLKKLGVDFIKVHSATPRAAYFGILEEAGKQGLLVAGHVPDSVAPIEAIRAGQRTIEHDWRIPTANTPNGEAVSDWMRASMQLVLDSASGMPKLWPYVMPRIAADDSASAVYDSATAAAFAREAASRQVWFDPTLVVLYTQHRRNETAIRKPPELKYVPPEGLEFEDGPPPKEHPTEADIMAGRRAYAQTTVAFRELVRAGAKFVAGTDSPVLPVVPGFGLQLELELLVGMGLSPGQAIAAATGNAAAAMGWEATTGTIAAGMAADLVLLDGDPQANIRNTRRIAAVVTRGRLLNRAALDSLLAQAETTSAGKP